MTTTPYKKKQNENKDNNSHRGLVPLPAIGGVTCTSLMDVGNGTLHFFFQEKHKNLSPHFIIMEIQKMTQAQVKKAIKECENQILKKGRRFNIYELAGSVLI